MSDVPLILATLICMAVGAWRPRRSTIWAAALAWPLVEWLRLLPLVTHPRTLLILPSAFFAMSAYAGVLLRRRAVTAGR